jgi:hypothetical protein
MTKTIVALFDEITVARQVVEDLVKADFSRGDISLIMNDSQNQYGHYLEKDYAPREDAVTGAEGAGFGAMVGALTGVLLGLVALSIPGLGLAIVAGPIVAGLTGAVAGALTGGVVGALVKTGVPEDEAPYYAEAIRRGATLISLQSDDTLRAEEVIHRYGTLNIHERISVWRQDGWKGFDTETIEYYAKPDWELVTVTTKEMTSSKLSPRTPLVRPLVPIQVPPLPIEEPQITEDDTIPLLPYNLAPPTINPLTSEATRSLIVNEAEMNHMGDEAELQAIDVVIVHPKE